MDFRKIANEFKTPTYVYDQNKIEKNYQKLYHAFSSHYKNFKIHYAVKANPNPAIIKILLDQGAGVDCSSPGELEAALRAGTKKENILYTGNYESQEDLSQILNADIKFNLDDLTSFERLLEIRKTDFVSFRINPGMGKGGHEAVVTGGTDAKFGIPYEKAFEAYKIAKEAGVQRFGLHMMTGSNNLEPYFFREAVEKLMEIGGDIFNRLDIKPEYVDIGGGFGIPYTEEDVYLDVELLGRLVCEKFTKKLDEYSLGRPQLLIEPGRYLVGNAGILITSVTGVKESYRTFVGVDAGMNTLARPALYQAIHRVSTPYNSGPTRKMNLCGQVCENADIFAKNLDLPKNLKEDDLVLLHDVGAYGFCMSSVYNGRPRPAEILINSDQSKLIRRRETIEDLFQFYP
ncbi:MAG: diaminopimelate decarboxylase [Bacteriovoracaceae bacterium]|jgi:diaminopimelate decarboxylase|nr:diaminopimelate decarboxylase [Bacteriovoracaceae bacterium]